MTEWLWGALALVALAVVGVAIMARSRSSELHARINRIRTEFDEHATTISDALQKARTEFDKAKERLTLASISNRNAQDALAAAKPVDEAKPFIMNSAGPAVQPKEVKPPYPGIEFAAAYYGIPPQPKEAAMRDEMSEGPALVAAMPESKYPGIATAYGRVIHWYCEHPESTYQDAYKAVVIDGASTYASVTEQPYQSGRFPIEALAGNVNASLYLNWISGRFTAATHQSVFVAMLRGDKAAVAEFINLGGSTNSGLMSTFNVDAYSSPVKDAVVQAMGA